MEQPSLSARRSPAEHGAEAPGLGCGGGCDRASSDTPAKPRERLLPAQDGFLSGPWLLAEAAGCKGQQVMGASVS